MEQIITNDKTSLGAKYNKHEGTVEFKLYSENATHVLLCIFNKPQGEDAVMTLDMEREGNIFKTSVKDYVLNCHKKPVYYGYRVFGPNWPYKEDYKPGTNIGFISKFDKNKNRFNPNKLAYDPYCKELSHLVSEVNPSMNLFRSGADFYLIDNAKWAPKSVYKKLENTEIAKISPRPFSSEIIGEVHLKDLTQNLNIDERGTYLGAKKFAKTIKNLGITMVEFLPLNEYDYKEQGSNHWGYMPLGYFSLARRYAYDKSMGNLLNEFRSMVDEFHKNGIKICLDMVYNHTGEAGLVNNNPDDAKLLSYSLIDNQTYYKTYENGYYRSNSGCGNDFNVNSKAVLDLIVESLVFWVKQGVDAFRFDLAAALLENSCDCNEIYDNINSLAGTLKERLKEKSINVVDDFTKAQDGVVLIAEPWTCGGNQCYQLGNFPSYWAEWNDIARDTIRKITLKPNEISPMNIRNIIEGTPDIFKTKNKSVNYISCHDGFSLYDLNSYKKKNPNTQGGSDWEISGDYEQDKKIKENCIRKQLAVLMLSYGTPMVQIGDIIAHSKLGNNNSYNHDDSINYLNWDKALKKDTLENRITEFTRNLIQFRLSNPIFSSDNFSNVLSYHYDNGEIAQNDNRGYWDNNKDDFFGVLINSTPRIYVAMSKSDKKMDILLPKTNNNLGWHKCLDTFDLQCISLTPKDYIKDEYILNPNSLCIFLEK
ncbi:MAG: hypothetical protein IJ877_07270 [Candidatus Gastranaerophilales bacterium]|nr:hypothetical protein [Candidatus Gastranaerophilales bacterium]